MSRLLTAVPTLVPVAALFAAAPVPDEAKAPVLFFPTTVGAKWTYQHPFPFGEETRVVTAVERKGDAHVVSVGRFIAGTASLYMKVQVSDKGLYRLETLVVTTTQGADGKTTSSLEVVAETPPVGLLKLPARAGDRWTPPHAEGRSTTCTVGEEEAVRVPAGAFTAVPVDFTLALRPGAPPIRERHWYARGVGPIKWTTPDGGEVVLKAFSPAGRSHVDTVPGV